MQISEAFKRFGISDGDDSVLVVLVHREDESQLLSDIKSMVNGQQVPVEDISLLTDQDKIKKVRVLLCVFFMWLTMEYNAVNSKCHIQDTNVTKFSFILFPIYLKAINFVI